MITSRFIHIITAVLMCICLVGCGVIVYAANVFDTIRIPGYQKRMFGDEVAMIDIRVDKDEWQDMLSTAQAKEWISADLIINGERFSTIGIRAKGNSSLSMGGGMRDTGNSNSYSLQFKADKYIDGQSFFGLDTFCVNNMMGDSTYMKDYISYDIMKYIGVDTPLANYANVTVNGEDYGFGIMLERYDQSYLERVNGVVEGNLYNVKIGMGRRGDFEDAWQDVENERPVQQQVVRGFGNVQGGGMIIGFGGAGTGGGSLVYTDDNISSYSAIFDNAVFSGTSNKDKKRVIVALENLNTGTNLETYIDVDAALRYFAAHTFVVNLDSYTSNMQQNYYLYERGGRLTILPWDYNLSFGGFQSGDASGVVNYPIDTPVSGVSMEERPMLNKLLEVDEYRDRYHNYLDQIVKGYFESGLFENTINELDAKISEFVKNDISAQYTFEQYETSLQVFTELGRLRAQSIAGQLEGAIPTTSSGQSADGSALIDASGINLSTLGSMMGGGGMNRGVMNRGGQEIIPGSVWERQAITQNGDAPQGAMGPQGAMRPQNSDAQQQGATGPQMRIAPQGGGPTFTVPGADTPQSGQNYGYIIASAALVVILAGAIILVARPAKNVV